MMQLAAIGRFRFAARLALACVAIAAATGCAGSKAAPAQSGDGVRLDVLIVGVDTDPARGGNDLDRLRTLATPSTPETDAQARSARAEVDRLVDRLRAQGRVYASVQRTVDQPLGERSRITIPSAGGSELILTIRTAAGENPDSYLVDVEPRFTRIDSSTQSRFSRMEWEGRTLGFTTSRFTLGPGRTGGATPARTLGTPTYPQNLQLFVFVTAGER